MEGIREWVLAVCAAAIGGGLVHMLAPQGNVQKVLKVSLSVFFLCCLLSPVWSGDLQLEFEQAQDAPEGTQRTEELQQAYEDTIEAQVRAQLAEAVRIRLGENGITCLQIVINTTTTQTGSIDISSVTVELDEGYSDRAEDVEREVEELLGICPEVYFRQEG